MNGYLNNKKAKGSDPSQKGVSKSMINGNQIEDDYTGRDRRVSQVNKYQNQIQQSQMMNQSLKTSGSQSQSVKTKAPKSKKNKDNGDCAIF